jgi:chromosome segregation ATPase
VRQSKQNGLSINSNLFGDEFKQEDKSKQQDNSEKQQTIDNIDLFNSIESSNLNEQSQNQGKPSGIRRDQKTIRSNQGFDEFGFGEPPEKQESTSRKGGKVSMVFGASQRRQTPRKVTSVERGTSREDHRQESKSVQVLKPSVYHKSAQRSEVSFRVEKEEVQKLQERVQQLEVEQMRDKKQLESLRQQTEELEEQLIKEKQSKEDLKGELKKVEEELNKKGVEVQLLRKSTRSKLEEAKQLTGVLKTQVGNLKTFLQQSKDMRKSVQRVERSRRKNQSKMEELELEIDKQKHTIRSSANSINEFKMQLQKLREENIELVQRKEKIDNIENDNPKMKGELEWILGELIKLKTEKEKLESEIAVNNMKIRKKFEGIKLEIQSEKREREEERERLENDNLMLRDKNRELVDAIEDFKGELGNSEIKSRFGDLGKQTSWENTAKKKDLEIFSVEKGRLRGVEEQLEEAKVDLEVHKEENRKLLKELVETQGQLASIEAKYDIAHIDQKLEEYEKENSELNQKNIDLMDELFTVKTELQRFLSRGKHNGWMHDNKLKDLQKENNKLKNKIKNMQLTNDFEPVVFSKKVDSENKNSKIQNIASLQKNIGRVVP